MTQIEMICKRAKEASFLMSRVTTANKNNALHVIADKIMENQEAILSANEIDLKHARESGISGALLDRLTLNPERIAGMAQGLVEIAALPDPVGKTERTWVRPNGLEIGEKRVPIGVVGVIYEARPNVTADVAGLTLKSGNCVVLKGGKEAIHSNTAIAKLIESALEESGLPTGAVQLITDTDREATLEMLRMAQYIDVLIPRGGEGLKKVILANSAIPVIFATAGNCHVYVDESADLKMARDIILNAKTQRPGVCNAAESLLVHKAVAAQFVPEITSELAAAGVEIRACDTSMQLCTKGDCAEENCAKRNMILATEQDWGAEYLDMIVSLKVIDSFEAAVAHINQYGSRHSEVIVTENEQHGEEFLNFVDAAAVYVNASSRFTDGFEFGFGAEIGISNQKLHARGPIGLEQLTTLKYVIHGTGQIRS